MPVIQNIKISYSATNSNEVHVVWSALGIHFLFIGVSRVTLKYTRVINIKVWETDFKLDICVQRTWMPPPSAFSKMALWLRYWLSSNNYRSIKADLYNIEVTNEGPCRSKRLAFSLQSNLGHEYETHMFSSLSIHSISLNYDLDL